MAKDWQMKVCGKWILAGEHSVLTGQGAIAFPLPSRSIKMTYTPLENCKGNTTLWLQDQSAQTKMPLQKNPPPPSKSQSFLWFVNQVLQQGLKGVQKKPRDLKGGRLSFQRDLPLGAGLGASAVVSVLVGKWFQFLQWLKEDELFSFCHRLENTVHGASSGLDVAVLLQNQPLWYQPPPCPASQARQGKKASLSLPRFQVLRPTFKPCFFLSDSGFRVPTRRSVQKVFLFQKQSPSAASHQHRQMGQAVRLARQSLLEKGEGALKKMVRSFLLAEECFLKWGLINEDMKKHTAALRKQGALAVKPTGAGGGGFLLSVWENPPPTPPPGLVAL